MTTRGLRIGAASIAHWALGAVWYAAFGGVFARFIGTAMLRELEARSEAVAFSFAFLSSLAVVLALDWILRRQAEPSWSSAFASVAIVWTGIVVATQSQTVLFEGRRLGLFVLGVGYQLVAMTAAAAILCARRPRSAPD